MQQGVQQGLEQGLEQGRQQLIRELRETVIGLYDALPNVPCLCGVTC